MFDYYNDKLAKLHEKPPEPRSRLPSRTELAIISAMLVPTAIVAALIAITIIFGNTNWR